MIVFSPFFFLPFVIVTVGFACFKCFKYGVAVGSKAAYKAGYRAGYQAHMDDAYAHAAEVRKHEAWLAFCEEKRQAQDREWWESLRGQDFSQLEHNTRALTGW